MFMKLEELEESIKNCNRCRLCSNRKRVLFGEGNKEADIMFIGDGPKQEEELNKKLYSGVTGQYLIKCLEAINMEEEKIYYTNILKCKIQQGKLLDYNEVNQCINILRNQVVIIKPKIIVLLGSSVVNNILGKEYIFSEVCGCWIEKKDILYMPTYHPEEFVRDNDLKLKFLQHMKLVKKKLNEIK